MKAAQIFRTLFERGETALGSLRSIALKPELEKKPKDYNAAQACELIGKSRPTIVNRELENVIPKARTVKKAKRDERVYNLKEINFLRDYFQTRISKPKGSKAIRLAVINFKGGSGKTYTAITNAQAFAIKGYRVLLIDCDSQGSTSVLAGMNPDKDISSDETLLNILCGKEENIRKIIKKTHWDGLDLIPANLALYNAEMKIPYEMIQRAQKGQDNKIPFQRLAKAIAQVEDEYDIVIFDTPPSVGAITSSVLWSANAILVPMVPNIIDLSSTIQFLRMTAETLEFIDNKNIDLIRIQITKHNHRATANELHDVVKATFGNSVMTNYMIESEAISRAASNMQTLHEVNEVLGDRKSYKRAIDYASKINDELERCFKAIWDKQVNAVLENKMEPVLSVAEQGVGGSNQ